MELIEQLFQVKLLLTELVTKELWYVLVRWTWQDLVYLILTQVDEHVSLRTKSSSFLNQIE